MKISDASLVKVLQPQIGWIAIAAAVVLTIIGLDAIDMTSTGSGPNHYAQQVRWALIAAAATFFCMLPSGKFVRFAAWPMMAISIVLLIIVILPGVPRSIVPMVNGATCWINLGFMQLQPSEIARVAFILVLADFLRHRIEVRTITGVLVPFGIMLVPMVLIAKEPDLGVAMVFPPTVAAILVAAGARIRHLAALAGMALLAVAFVVATVYFDVPPSLKILRPHQEARIKAMISRAQSDPRLTMRADAYQQEKAIMLVGAGGREGFEPGRAEQIVRYNRLPEDHTDMIFPVIVSRWGFNGAVAVLGLYAVIFACMLLAAGQARDGFARLAIVGFAAMLAFQTFVNIGMTVGMLPVTGITLPFVSYGGQSLVMCGVMLGLTCSLARQRGSSAVAGSLSGVSGDSGRGAVVSVRR